MEKKWTGTTYGNTWMHTWLIRGLKYIDVRILYVFSALFVVPVCLIVNPSYGIIYRYFRRRFHYGRLKSFLKTYLNHCLFAQVVIDRFAMYAGKKFNVEIEGNEHFLTLIRQDRGFIQLSAHVGNYELAGYTMHAEKKSINVLVFAHEKESVMNQRAKMFSAKNIHMIPVMEDMSHLFAIDAALNRGEIVSMTADRVLGSQKMISSDFLGAEAEFPAGPFTLATMRGYDVLMVNVIKIRPKSYKIFVTSLPYDRTLPRKQQMLDLGKAYIAELEKMVRKYPAQWYNFFEFWK